jgi:hypothetical protein
MVPGGPPTVFSRITKLREAPPRGLSAFHAERRAMYAKP